MNSTQQYVEQYKQKEQQLIANSAEALNAKREEALNTLERLGFPNKKEEKFRYTDIEKMFSKTYSTAVSHSNTFIEEIKKHSYKVSNLNAYTYYITNDKLTKETYTLPQGVIVGELNKISKEYPQLIKKYYGTLAKTEKDPITAVNTLFAQDGLVIYVPRGIKVDRPLQIINLLHSHPTPIHRRTLIILEESSKLKALFSDYTIEDVPLLSTQVIEAFVSDDAHLTLYNIEETHKDNTRLSNTFITQGANSKVNHNQITLHNGITRNQTNLVFKGEGSECILNGCVIANKEQHVENNTLIDHAVPHCASKELYKYSLDEKATGAFVGMVLVHQDAQQVNSEMRNQNICSTKEARMFTQPMLEIYADDVKCAHGATVGQLNNDALFYMRQRGISEKGAKTLLQFAFINEVIDKIDLEPLQEHLHNKVKERL